MADQTVRHEETRPVGHPEETAVERESDRRQIAKASAGGFGTEALLGIGAVVLGILGLVGVVPRYMAAVAAIGLGAAFLMEAAAFGTAAAKTAEGAKRTKGLLGGGATIQGLAGAAGITLGVLALLGLVPTLLLSAAAIVFGGSLLISSGSTTEIEAVAPPAVSGPAQDSLRASAATRALVGIASVVLGILALTEIGATMTFVLVAMLVVGGAAFLSGTAVSGRMGTGLR